MQSRPDHPPLGEAWADRAARLDVLCRAMTPAGEVAVGEGGLTARFDLRHVHERRYLVRALFGLPYPQADIDTELLRMVIRPGDVCVDAGANIGVTAIEMLRFGAAEVHAFEPVPELAARLRRLDIGRVHVTEVALGRGPGVARLVLSAAHNQGHTLKEDVVARFPAVFGPAPQHLEVRVTTLDAYAEARGAGWGAEVWKIDVEGAEEDLLAGAACCLRDNPPRAIVCESYGAPGGLTRALGAAWPGYRAFITKATGALVLDDVEAVPDGALHFSTAPMFLFLHGPSMDLSLAAGVEALAACGAALRGGG